MQNTDSIQWAARDKLIDTIPSFTLIFKTTYWVTLENTFKELKNGKANFLHRWFQPEAVYNGQNNS